MSNILRFIFKYHYFLLFLLLETLSFFLLVSYNQPHQQIFLNSSGNLATSVFELKTSFNNYVSLKKANEELSRENALLRSQLFNSTDQGTLTSATSYSDDSLYYFISAKVVNNSVNKLHNYLTIDKGNKHGMHPGMGVISARGLVGVTRNVSKNYTTIISLLNTQLKISAKLRDTDYFGSLTWTGYSPTNAMLYEIPAHARVSVGDAIVTSGYSAIFPEGILIGTIENFELKQGEGFYEIDVRLSVDFNNLTYVESIKNSMKDEQVELEKITEND